MGIGVTHFGYVGFTMPNKVGGTVVPLKTKVALAIGDVVMIDAATDDQVDKATAASDLVAGVCIGKQMASGASDLDEAPAALDTALIQVSGIAEVVADAAVARGDRVKVAATAGRVASATALAGAIAAATIPAGATPVTSTAANGAIVTVPNPTFSGDGSDMAHLVGKALQAAAAQGDKIRVLLTL